MYTTPARDLILDSPSTGTVGRGVAPEGKKATVTLVLSRRRHTRSQRRRHVTLVLNDAEFQKLIEGKTNAQKLFMSGKDQGGYDEVSVLLLVGRSLKANNCRATKLDPILKKAQAQAPKSKL